MDGDPSPAATALSSDLLDSLADVLVTFDGTGEPTRWNQSLREVTEYSDETLSSLSTDDLFVDAERVREQVTAVAGGDAERRTFEATVLTADGRRPRYEFAATTHGAPGDARTRDDSDGDSDGDGDDDDGDDCVVCVGRATEDPSERDVGRDGYSGFTRHRAVLESLPDAVYAIESDGTLVYANEAYTAMKDVSRDTLLGTDIDDWVTDETVRRADELRTELAAGARDVAAIEYEFVTGDGERFPAELRFGRVDDAERDDGDGDGDTPECGLARVGMIRDVTERAERERRLQRQNERLDGFAAIVSHDLRNPLNVAEGRLELAREECETEHLAPVASAHDRMRELIDDLLALARSGQGLAGLTSVALPGLAERCWDSVSVPDATLDVRTDATVRADEARLQRLLENLFRNAVEHGDGDGGGDVTLTVGDLPEGDGFFVADDGPGVPPAARGRAFEPGYSTTTEGTGLGLSIVRDVAEAHGWTVELTDADDGGARFEFRGVATE